MNIFERSEIKRVMRAFLVISSVETDSEESLEEGFPPKEAEEEVEEEEEEEEVFLSKGTKTRVELGDKKMKPSKTFVEMFNSELYFTR